MAEQEPIEVTRVVETAVPPTATFEATATAVATMTPTPLQPSPTPAPTVTATAVPRAHAPLPTNPQTYFNSELGYSLQYGEAWQLAVGNYEGSIQWVTLTQEDYELRISVRLEMADENASCGGMFSKDFDLYWRDMMAGQDWWRHKAELGEGNGYDENTTFLSVISPVQIFDEPNEHGYIGEYSCLLPVDGRLVDIGYRLGASTTELAAGDYDETLLGEMDNIVASLKFVEPVSPANDITCTRPEDIQMIGVEIVNDPVPCIVWQDITDDETGFVVTLAYEQSGESFRYQVSADSKQLVLPLFDAPRLQESAEQCRRRQSFRVDITAVRSADFGDRLIASMMGIIECDPAALATATPGA